MKTALIGPRNCCKGRMSRRPALNRVPPNQPRKIAQSEGCQFLRLKRLIDHRQFDGLQNLAKGLFGCAGLAMSGASVKSTMGTMTRKSRWTRLTQLTTNIGIPAQA